jgi:hypothetical protein
VTTPTQITPEMRQAVLAEECRRRGDHILLLTNAVQVDGTGSRIAGRDGKLAHMHCDRCGAAWIVVEASGIDYADAAAKYRARLKPDDPAVSQRP